MNQIFLNQQLYFYQIKYKKILSIRLHLQTPNSFYISCPYFTSKRRIETFIRGQSNWIISNSKKLVVYPKLSQLKKIKILAKSYKIDLSRGRKNSFIFNPHKKTINIVAKSLCQQNLTKIYDKNFRPIALKIIRVEIDEILHSSKHHILPYFAKKMNKISLRNQKSRFGSCSSKGNLSFNWQIIFFPPDKFRHIILHELVHLKIKNHSADFWGLLAQLDKKSKQNNKWLKKEAQKHFIIKA